MKMPTGELNGIDIGRHRASPRDRHSYVEPACASEPAGQHVRFSTHETVVHEGDPAKSIYRVLDGAVMLYKLLPDGRRQVVELLGAGDVFGLTADGCYDCSAETLTPSDVLVYDRAAIERFPDFLLKLAKRINAQVRALHDHALLLGRKSALERVASFVMSRIPNRGGYACPGPTGTDDHATVHLGMTRQEIADYLGLTLETVSRAFSELRRRGVVTIEKSDGVRVNNICRICQLTGAH